MGDGDDSATSSHQGSRQLGPLQKSSCLRIDGLLPLLDSNLHGRLVELGNFWPGVTDEDIEFPEFTLHMIHHSPNVIGPVYIRLNNEPVRAALPYFCERVIRGVNVLIVVNANLRAAFCQLHCYGPANPPRRSRDQGVLALQRHTVWPSFMRKSTRPDPADRPSEKMKPGFPI